jgi:peptidoglycan/xylan/chitin deacetylase (PgdA/CDA1 family)
MRAISLLYHDVVPVGDFAASGFAGGDADIYKIELPEFQQHLKALARLKIPPISAAQLNDSEPWPLLLTFDDGGSSAYECIADLLETLSWRGHFFVTTDWIGNNGFLKPAQIRELYRRGHWIGTHSCSHPPRMSHCSRQELNREWNKSVAVLSDTLGVTITMGSVPGGYYRQKVAEAAAEAGITTLFTSEPRTRAQLVRGCVVLGRYTIRKGVRASTAAAIASGKPLPRFRQLAYWNAKKVLKTAGGVPWLRIRKHLLAG